MSRTLAGLTLLVVLTAAAWLAVALLGAPRPVPASAPPEVFSAERAMDHVRALAAEPRPMGSEAHARARDYLLEQLRAQGLEPEVQTAVGRSAWGTGFGTVDNVLARLPGTRGGGGGPAVLLLAHYDSVHTGPGASDDAAGVAALLETLRALAAGPAPAHDVIALFSDGEEAGLLGAEAFVHDHPWAADVALVLNFEARGTRGPSLMFETGAGNRRLIERFAAAAPHPAAASYSYEVYRRLPNDTDFTVFRRAGVPGLNFAFIHGAVGYHTARDSIELLDPASLQHHGANALALARELAGGDLDAVAAPPGPAAGGDAVYFNPLGRTFVWFPASWVPALAALLGLGALALLVLAIARKRAGLGALAAGLGFWVLAAALAAGLAVAARGLVLPSFYDFRIWGDGSSVAWSLFGATLAALGAGSALYLAGRRLISPAGLAAGGLVLWLAIAVAVCLAAPGASYLFLVPLAAQLPAFGWLFGRRPDGGGGEGPIPPLAWGLLAASAVVAALIWAPALALVAVGLQGGALAVLAPLAVLLLALLAPQLELMTSPRPRWAVPAGALAAGVALVVAVRLASGFGPESPRPTSLVYLLDGDSGEARWASFEAAPSPWTRGALGEGSERASLERFLGHRRELAVAPAPALVLPAAEIVELEAADAGGEPASRRVRVVPPPGAGRLRLLVAPAGELRAVTVQGRESDLPAGAETLSLLYHAPPEEGVELVLATGGGQDLVVAAVAQWLRLPAEAEGGPPPRGEGLMTAGGPWDVDTTQVRTELRLGGAASGAPISVE